MMENNRKHTSPLTYVILECYTKTVSQHVYI